MKKRKINVKLFGIIIVLIVTIILVLLFISKGDERKLIGTWVSKGGTIYEFKENGKGIMVVPLKKYKFTYRMKDNVLSLDFEDKKAIDTDYKYYFKKEGLVVKSDRGTFTFTRK